jgi:hypothetical protein
MVALEGPIIGLVKPRQLCGAPGNEVIQDSLAQLYIMSAGHTTAGQQRMDIPRQNRAALWREVQIIERQRHTCKTIGSYSFA